MEWYFKVLKNYVNFEGRARRKEYWMFVLFNFLISIVFMLVDSMLNTRFENSLNGIFGIIYSLAVAIPSLAVGVRRLHDIDKSGWNLLLGLIPLVGSIWLLILFCSEGEKGSNKYGDDPKAVYVA